VLDFTSAHYLGLRHPSRSLRPWSGLATGKPAALAAPPGAAAVARQLAELQGCERATLLPSTLHLFFDLFSVLAHERVRIYMDTGTYMIAHWGVERAASRGVPVRRFPHHDAGTLRSLIARERARGVRPIVVSDGFCPSCGRLAPTTEYLRAVERDDGFVVIDDTQALGVLGEHPTAAAPYGHGGGGILRRNGISSPRAIVGSSLAKGFGVPIAALAGSKAVVDRFDALSETRVHSSPPSAAVIHAAESAMAINRTEGEARRMYLAGLARRLADGLRRLGVAVNGDPFPVLTLTPADGIDVPTLQEDLLRCGLRTVAVRGCQGVGQRIAMLVTALHRTSDIDNAIAAFGQVARVRGGRIRAEAS
jgi:8-amino-7-oxononanoate synthase